MMEEANLVQQKTLFIDDIEENTVVAKNLGMKVLHIQPGTLMEKLPGTLTKCDLLSGIFCTDK